MAMIRDEPVSSNAVLLRFWKNPLSSARLASAVKQSEFEVRPCAGYGRHAFRVRDVW